MPLQSLEEIKGMVPTSLSQTPFFTHLLSSVPSLRNQIKDAVTASNKSWLLVIRNVSRQVGRLALENMESRRRRWKARQERDPLLRSSRVGSAVEVTGNEGKEGAISESIPTSTINHDASADVLDNEKLNVDFKPLHQCIHIYTALDSLEELQRSYHADRKVSNHCQHNALSIQTETGPIRPHSSFESYAQEPPFSYRGDSRVLYYRVPRYAYNSWI